MRKILAMASVALMSMLFTGSAFAQGTPNAPPPAPAPGAPTDASTDEADKKIGIGAELQFMLPIGDFADGTGPQIGPIVRFGYRVMPPLELTFRTGYLFGIGKTPPNVPAGADVSTSFSNIPLWLGARYFFMDPYAGVYGAAELAINLMSAHSTFLGQSSSTGFTREGFNLGVGYVISKDLPIDIRAQFSFLNLLGKDSATNEPSLFAIGISAGYTFQF
ncbi:MAG: hypothetical protein JWO86_9020 [Myxococcaceae bacterium]|nr:hypothetical protein [Myxococcaceae bacterium]